MARQEFDYELMKLTLKKPWLTVKDIQIIYMVGTDTARGMFKKAYEKAINENWFIPVTRPRLVPTPQVLELFPIKGARKQC